MPSEAAIQAPPGEPSNALVDGSCAREITPVPRPGDYLQIEIDHWGSRSGKTITDPKKGRTPTCLASASAIISARTKIQRRKLMAPRSGVISPTLPKTFATSGGSIETRSTSSQITNSIRRVGVLPVQMALPEDYVKSLSLPSTLTKAKTPAAPCIYESHPPDRFGYATSNTVISYVNADGWMFQRVETKKAKGTNWIFHNRYVFKIVEPFTIERPQPGSKEVNYFSD
jgi:hypothetical protein